MKYTKLFATLLCIIALLITFAACDNTPGVNPGSGTDTSQDQKFTGKAIMMVVATYDNNLEIGGKLAVNSENEYAVIKAGDEIKEENVIILTSENDISNLSGQLAEFEVENGSVKNVTYFSERVSGALSSFRVEDGKYFDSKGTEIKLSESLINDPKTRYFAFDGINLFSGNGVLSSDMGIGTYTDDVIEFTDTDGDGVYDYAKYTPVYNALKITAVDGTLVTFEGGYGSAASLGFFKKGAATAVSVKKSISTVIPDVGTYVNATVKLDASSDKVQATYKGLPVQVTIKGEADSVVYPLSFVKQESVSDMMVKLNGSFVHWSSALSEFDGADGAGSGRTLMKNSNINYCYNFIKDERGNIVYSEIASSKEVELEKLIGATSFESENGTVVSACLDIQGWWNRIYATSTLNAYATALQKMGVRRVYLVTSAPGFPMYAYSSNGYSTRRGFDESVAYFKNLGFEYPDFAFVEALHKNGIECFASYKPYEGGGGATAPLGAEVGWGVDSYEDIYGQRLSFDKFITDTLANGKDYRVVRRDDGINDNIDGNITKITVQFLMDSATFRENYGRRNETVTYGAYSSSTVQLMADGQTYTNKSHHKRFGINLWVSDNNGEYKLFDKSYNYKYVESTEVLYDANGDTMFDGAAKRIVTLEITGISIANKFVAVTFDNATNNRLNLHSMVHIYSGANEIPSSKARYVRTVYDDYSNDENYVWGCESECVKSTVATGLKLSGDGTLIPTSTSSNKEKAEKLALFTKYGFEFNWYPFGESVENTNSVIAIARGKVETFPGGLCEAYEEVREYWLSYVETLAKGGFDGVVIRLQSHSSMVADYKNYGFNEPIMEEYKKLYGQAAYNTITDPNHTVTDEEYLRIMKIRGDYFTLFLDDAAEVCHKYGTKFSVMLRESYVDPQVSHHMNEPSHWTMPKIVLDWKHCVDISDEVTIKDYIYSPQHVSINAKEIREYAHSQGKKVWIECYDSQADMLIESFMKKAIDDEYIDGVIIYEISGSTLQETWTTYRNFLDKCGFKLVDKKYQLDIK